MLQIFQHIYQGRIPDQGVTYTFGEMYALSDFLIMFFVMVSEAVA